MKRYTLPELLSGAKNGLVTLDSDYVLYSDLITAGCLVPVPVGEECEWSISEFDNFVKDGILYVYISGIDRHLKMDTQRLYDCDDDTIVQPIRLVPLA